MAYAVNKKSAQYATSGFIAMRCNPDGTTATGKRTIGFTATIDISSLLDSNDKCRLQIKVGRGNWQSKEVDFSDVASTSAITVQEAVSALNDAGFSGVTFSEDVETLRLVAKATDITVDYIQIYGKLAGAMKFGNCELGEGLGVYFIDYFSCDDTITIQPTVQQDESSRIEQEGSHGTKTTLITAGGRNGEDIAITTKPLDFELMQLIQGGKHHHATAQTPATYEPPLPSDNRGRPVTIIKFDPLYMPNTENTEGQEIAIKAALYYSGIGQVGDESGGSKSLTQFTYNLKFGVYNDENGVAHSNPKHIGYTDAQWEAFNIAKLLELPAIEE